MSLGGMFKNRICKCLAIACVACLLASDGLEASNGENKITGHINHTEMVAGEHGTCSISKLPTTVEEFIKLQDEIGTEPQGAVMCFLVAMNIYANDEVAGKECLELASYNIKGSEMSLLKQKLRGPEGDSYVQKYLPFACMKGATPENNYTPSRPYTVEVSVNKAKPYSKLTEAAAPVIYMTVKTKGTDMGYRSVSVIQPKGEDFFVVYERSSLFLQVKNADNTRKVDPRRQRKNRH